MSRLRVWSAALALVAAAFGCSKRESASPSSSSLETAQTRPAEAWLAEDPVRLLRDFVRIDTTFEEERGARFLKELFDCAGIASEIVCPAPRRCNLLARLPGRRKEGALLLLNHIDVAEAYPSFWREARPFGGEIRAGYIYGRGTYDMKSTALAQALAMRRLKERNLVPASDILFLAEADEEMGQRWGSRWLLEHRPEWFAGVTQVLNEGGSNEMVLRDVRFWGLETIQAGFALAELEAATAAPLELLAARWTKVEGPIVEAHPHVVMGFDMLANHLRHPLTDPLRHLDRVRQDPEELASLPDRYGAFLEARIHWYGPYPYPPEKPTGSRAIVVVSVPPDLAPRPYLDPVLKDMPREVRLLRVSAAGPAGASPYPTAFTNLLKRVTEAYWPGVPFGPMPTFGGFTTSILFRQKGFATYGYSPIGVNITDASRRHGNDERLFLPDYVRGCALYADLVEEFALFPPLQELSPPMHQN